MAYYSQTRYPLPEDGNDYSAAVMTKNWYRTAGAGLDKWSSADLGQRLLRWRAALAPLLKQSRTAKFAHTFIPATVLYIQALALDAAVGNYVDVSPAPDPLTKGSDLIPHSYGVAEKVISLCWDLVAREDFARGFVMDIGVIPFLWTTIITVPWEGVKRDGIRILREMVPRVESVWDAGIVADAAEAFVNLEKRMGPI